MSSRPSVLVLVALLGCKDPPRPAAHDDAATPRALQIAAPNQVAMAEPVLALPTVEAFVLDSPGAEPRAALRTQPRAGTASFVRTRTLSERHLDDHGAFTPAVALPALHDGFTVTGGDAPGVLALRALPGDAAAKTGEADAALETWRQLLAGRRATVTVDDRGQLGAIRFADDPSNTHSEPARLALVTELLALVVPLPAEPIGIGARWRVVTIYEQDGAHAKQTATYTLLAPWRVHVQLQRVAEEQRLALPGAPAGTVANLVAMFQRYEGDVTLDPAHALITSGTLTSEARLHLRLARPNTPPSEQIFERTGSITYARTE